MKWFFGWVFFVASLGSYGQTNQQVWVEYMLAHPFANVWELEHAVTYSTLVGTPKWRSLDYAPTLTWSLTQHIDVMGAFTLSSVVQTEDVNTLEIRPMLGSRIHFTPNMRMLTRLLVRFENRNFQNLETKDWTSSNRMRFRVESLIQLNNPTMYNKDKLMYGIADAEWFITMDQDLQERFANRFRMRVGIGYRLTYTWRFEFLYSYQESKDQIETPTYTRDNLFRFRIRHFINKSKPSKTLGVGN